MPMSRYANRHHRQTETPIVVASVVDTRIVVEGENLDVNELDEVRRELAQLKQSHLKVIKRNNRIQIDLMEQTQKLHEDRKELTKHLLEYEAIIQQLESAGHIIFRNRPVGRKSLETRTLDNMDFVYIHDKEGNEIAFQDLHNVLQELEDKNKNLKVLCEKLLKQSLPTGGSIKIIKEPNKEMEVSLNHDDSGEISGEVKCDKEWSWKGIDYTIDVINKKVFDMEGRQVGETIGKIPTLWDKWWEELD